MTDRRPARALLLALCMTLGAPWAAQAGRAQVGANLGTWADGDLRQAQVSGSSWRDGVLLGHVSDLGDAFDDAASASLRVEGVAVNHSARARLQGGAQLRVPGDPDGLAFAGDTEVAADLLAGRLDLRFATDHVAYTSAGGARREAYVSAYPYAELFEVFEVVYPLARAEPVWVTLDMRLDGRISGNTGDNGRIGGVQAYLHLAGVDTGESHPMLDAVWRSEAGVAGQTLTFSGALQPGGCSASRGLCSGFINLYAALDMRARTLATGAITFGTAAPLALDFGAQLALSVSPGVTLLRIGGVDDALPAVAWATVSAVPEPATLLLWLAGLGCFGVRRCVSISAKSNLTRE